MHVTLHMASSLDGFIMSKEGDLDWFETGQNYAKGHHLTEEEIQSFLSEIDVYVMGSKTYEQALEIGWVYGDKPVVVCSSRSLSTEKHNVEIYNGSLSVLIHEKLKVKYQTIWIAGGSELAKSALEEDLVDEISVSVLPVILGGGLPFFKRISRRVHLDLKSSRVYDNGVVENTYLVRKLSQSI